MTIRASKKKYAPLLVAFVAALAVSMSVASAANAEGGSYNTGKLPGKTWTCGPCEAGTMDYQFAQAYESGSSVCIGPVQWNGSIFVSPYGWKCGNHSVE
jgi:hypothetical protein